MRTLTVVGWRRPEYLRAVLISLKHCVGIENYKVWVILDHGHTETLEVAVEESLDDWTVMPSDRRLGCNGITRQACELGFSYSDYHVHLEDDCLPARDCLSWFEWARRFGGDQSVFTVSAYSKQIGRIDAYSRRSWFTPWGWATWADRWGQLASWWREEDRYPWGVQACHYARQFRYEVHPVIARVRNIGRDGGHNNNPAQWEREQFNRSWAGDATVTEWTA